MKSQTLLYSFQGSQSFPPTWLYRCVFVAQRVIGAPIALIGRLGTGGGGEVIVLRKIPGPDRLICRGIERHDLCGGRIEAGGGDNVSHKRVADQRAIDGPLAGRIEKL